MPPALGRLMGLSEAEIAHAIGICTSHALPLGILDADQEENSMTKNLRFGFVAYHAVLACMLAKRGFTGPVRVIEGDAGFRQVVLDGDMDLAEEFVKAMARYTLENCAEDLPWLGYTSIQRCSSAPLRSTRTCAARVAGFASVRMSTPM